MITTLYRLVLTIIVSIPKFIVKRIRIGEENLDYVSPLLIDSIIIATMLPTSCLIANLSIHIGLIIGISLMILNWITSYFVTLIIIGAIN